MFDWTNILFYLVFLSQIYLMSYYFPTKVLRRMRCVLETYPPSKYPKLYPKPVEYYKMGQLGFVSSRLVAAAVVLYFTGILFDLYVHEFVLDWGHDTIQRAVVITLLICTEM